MLLDKPRNYKIKLMVELMTVTFIIHTYTYTYIHTHTHILTHIHFNTPEPAHHLNMCVLSQNPTYIQYIFKYKIHTYINTRICTHLYTHKHEPFPLRQKNRDLQS